MKPIKILLSLFAVVLVAVGAWGQALNPPANPVGTQCGGGPFTVPTPALADPAVPFAAGCATVTLFAELVDINGNIVSTGGTAGSVTVGTMGAPAAPSGALTLPTGPLNNVFIRYRSGATAGGCVYSILSAGPGFNVGTAVAAPTGQILSALTVCQGTPITAQAGTCPAGTALKLYTTAAGAGLNNPPVATPTVGTFDLWAVCAQNAPGICETPTRTKVTFTVVAPPLAPSSHTLSKTTLCAAEVASTTLTITAHNCLASEQPFVSTSSTGSPELGLAGAPFAAPSTTTAYWSFCKNTTIAGCNSPGTAATPAAGTVTVNPTPINPFGLSLSKNSAPCPTNVGTLSVTSTCAGSGESMEVFTAATGGSRIAFGPAPANVATTLLIPSVPNTANSSTTYYVQCVTSLGCPSGRVAAGTFTVGAAIPAPTAPILSATTVCQGTPITAAANTCPAGTTLKLYTTATGTGVNNPPIATPTAGDFSLWAVCDAGSGCESTTRTKVDFKVEALPGAPMAHTLDKTTVCVAQVSSTTLRITGHNCLVSEQPFVSTSATGVPELGLAGATFAAPSATTNYFSFCKNTATGCNSPGTAGITITVNPTPIAPFGLSLSKNSAPCPTNVGTLSVTATCSNNGEVMEVYTAATGGTPVVFGPAPANVATTLAIAAVPRTANSTTTYYVQCVSAAPASCPSTRVAAGTFTVGADIAAPTAPILSATSICQGLPITAAANTCPAGTTLKLYTTATGTGVNNPPIATPTAGTFSLWAVCDAGSGCETSTRTKVDFTVVAQPGAPAAHTLDKTAVCSAQVSATTLRITAHNCLVGEQPFVSTSATGVPELGLAGATFAAPSATTNYFSFCKNTTTGCNSTGTAGATVTVNTTPINPFGFSLSKTSAPCPTNVGTLSVTATCAGSGETMEVYTVATGGTPVVFGPAPANVATTLAIASVPRTANSTTTYYVQCVSGAPASCPSTRLMVGTFTVGADIAAPTAPILSATTVCVGTPITASAATCPAGTTLKLYTTATGTGVNNPPIATPTAGDFSLWAVCDAGSGCETSTRTKVDFKVIALPSAPSAHALNQIAVCSAQAGTTMLRITGHNCLVSEQPFVSTSSTGSPVLGLAGATFTAPSATTAYFSFCKNTATGCNSTGTAGLTVTVNLTPIDPFGLSLSKNSAPCPSNVGTLSVTATCSGSGETMEVYTAATGGTPVVFGPAPSNTATTLLIPSVPSTANSTTTYYVQCVSGAPASCPSGRLIAGTFTVGADIAAPTAPILSATSVCQGTAITAGANTCPAGTTLKLYTTATGTGVNNPPIATPTAGTFSLWAVCDAGSGCETKARTKVDFTVVAQPAAPAGSLNSTAYCASEAATKQLQIASHTCAVGEVPFVSAKNDGSNPLGVGGVAFAAPGVTTTYFLFCRNGNTNCISTGTALPTVTVNPNPIDPFGLSLSKTSSPCPSAVAPLSVSATCSGIGETMEVYTAATGGSPLVFGAANVGTTTTLSIPAASIPTAPSTTFYVQCKATTGCLSNRIMVSTPFTVGADIPAGTVTFTQSTVCVGTPITVASTTCPAGTTPKFYTTATGTGTTTMPSATPSEGNYSLWVVCATSTGCESTVRTKVDYKVDFIRNAPVLGISTAGTFCFGLPVTFTVNHSCLTTDELRLYNGTTLVNSRAVTASPMSFSYTPTSANSSTNANSYTVACFNGTCEGGKSLAVNLTVNPSPSAPTFTGTEPLIPSSICALSPSLVLNNSLKCATASEVLVWYNAATGGSVVTTPNVTPTSTTTYYVACRSTSTNACESPTRTVATFTVNPTAAAPSNASITLDGVTVAAGATPAQICDIAGNTISFSSACASSETMWISVDGGNYSMAAVTQIVDGAFHTYRVRCQLGTGATACPGPESAAMMVKINPIPVAPVAALFANGNAIGTICAGGTAMTLTSNSTCGSNQTVWFDASNGNQLASLPTTTSTTTGTYSYFARCVGAGGCQSANSNTVTYTVLPVLPQATVTSSAAGVVCAGTAVTFTQNCPAGSTPQWSTGSTDNVLSITLQGAGSQSVFVKCIQSGYCDSPQSSVVTASWSSTFDITLINVGSSQSGTKGTSGTLKSAWASQFITVDAGPALASSTQGNPSIYFSENINKIAPRYWTAHVETCNLGTNGSVGFDMLATPEIGVPLSFNTIENNAPYLMYANRDGFTELYSQNNPFFGFYAADPLNPGKNAYDSGFPKGLYKLSVRYYSQKGLGLAPATRIAQGTQLAYSEYWFRIQSKDGVGKGAAREGVSETSEMEFALVAPNPVTRTLTVSINGAKGQEVKLNLVDAAGRIIKSSSVTPETNTHREEVDMSNQNTGMYFMNVSTSTKRANLKVLKVSQD